MVETSGAEKSLAFEVKGGRLKVLLEDSVPKVVLKGESYFVTESPSVKVGGKKYFVEEIV